MVDANQGVICKNCGFRNAAGDEFCGSCGQFLEWTGAPAGADSAAAATGAPEPAAPPPPPPPPSAAPSAAAASASPGAVGPPPPPPSGTGAPPPQVGVQSALPADLVRCGTCGRANQSTRTFCQYCGAKLTGLRAAKSGPAATDGSSRNRAVIAGITAIALLVVLAVVAVLAGWVKLPGATAVASGTPAPATQSAAVSGPPSPTTSSAPASSTPTIAPPTETASAAVPSDTPIVVPPTETPTAAPPTATPTATVPLPPTPTPTLRPPPTGYVCDSTSLSAPAPGTWSINAKTIGEHRGYDTFALVMTRLSSSGGTVSVDVKVVPADQVHGLYGVPNPVDGDLAIMMFVHDPVQDHLGSFGNSTVVGEDVLKSFNVVDTSPDVTVVLGVTGSGCFSVQAPGWSSGSSSTDLIVNIQR